MSNKESRLELLIDVFSLKKQRALVLPTLTPAELITQVIKEFGGTNNIGRGVTDTSPDKYLKMEYICDSADEYLLLKINSSPLLSGCGPRSPSTRICKSWLRFISTGLGDKLVTKN